MSTLAAIFVGLLAKVWQMYSTGQMQKPATKATEAEADPGIQKRAAASLAQWDKDHP